MRSVAGVDLEVFSGGQGEPLLMLHDYEYLNDWHPFLQSLAGSFSVVAPSHPGFGKSSLPPEFDSVDDLVYLYLDLLKELTGPATLVGAGIGGWIAAEMAVRSSENLARLVLVDAVGIKVSGRETADIRDTFIVGPDKILEWSWHDAAAGAQTMKIPGLPDIDEEQLITLLRNRQTSALIAWKPFMHNPKLRARLRRIDVPTLVIWGESDQLVTSDYGRAYAESIPGAKFELIKKAGHYPYLEQPEAFVAAVNAFAR
jgi:pimeloyl-ACP methyl ester carboxylesterase